MIWVKRVTIAILALLLVLVIAIAALLYTPAGVKIAIWGAEKALPALSVGGSHGSLLKGFTLEQVNYQDEALRLAANSLTLDIDDSCLLNSAVCISNLTVQGVDFSMPTLPASSDSEDESSEPITEIALPLPVTLNRLVLNDISLDILGNKVTWQSFSTAASMEGSHLTLKPTDWEGVELTLAKSEPETTSSVKTADPEPAKAIALPNVVLPLDIDVQRFTVKAFKLNGDTPQQINLLELVARGQKSDIAIDQLLLDIPQAKLNAKANVTLTGDYPLSLDAGLDIAMAPLSGHHLSLHAGGSVAELSINAQLKGTLDALLTGRLEPLVPDLPFDLNLKSNHLQWPIKTKPDFEASNSQLAAKGSLKSYSFTLKSQIDGKPMPVVGANLQGKGSLSDINLTLLALDSLGGTVTGSASASWKDLVNWKGKLAFSHIQPGLEWQGVPGDLSGHLITSGGLTRKGGWYVKLPDLAVDGTVMGQQLDLNGQLDASDVTGKGNLALKTEGLSIAHGPNSLTAQGQLTNNWDMTAKINAPDLSKSLPDLRGNVKGKITMSGKMAEPDLVVDLVGQALGWQGLASLSQLKLTGFIKPMPDLRADIRLIASNGHYDSFKLDTLSMQLNGTEQHHQLMLNLNAEPVGTDLRLSGSLDRKHGWQGMLEQGVVETDIGPWRLNHPTALGYRFKTQMVSVAAHCWQQKQASLCLTDNLEAGTSGHAKVAVNGFDFGLIAKYLPSNIKLSGSVGANAEATWAPQSAPYFKAAVRFPAGSVIQQEEPDFEPLTVGWDSITVNAEMKQDVLNADWLVAVKNNGDLSGRATVSQLTGDKQLEANLKLDRFMLGFLKPLLIDYHTFDGQVDANLMVSGPVMHPAVNGLLKVSNVKAVGRTVPLDVEKADITATFNGYQAVLNGEVITPDGKLNLKGDGDWHDLSEWRTQLKVNGRELEVTVPPMLAVKVSPDLTIKATPKRAEVTGSIAIPWGRITVDQLPKSAVAVSKDEILLNANLQPIKEKKKSPFAIKTNILVRIGDDVQLSAFGLKSGLVGDLNIRQSDKGPLVYGEINLRDGTYRSFGQELVIRKGQILFNGPADQPYLSIEAIRDPNNIENDVIAGIRVTGPADAPKVAIFSDPAMPQQNALSYILRGKDLDSESGDSGDAMTTALISMGLAQSGQLVGSVGEAFGVKDLALDTAGSGSESQVTISGYIAPGLQVKYGVGIFDSIGEFTVRYRLMKGLYVEVVSGLDSAVDLLYQFEFN
ncbi:autotransporter assembly complex protein TamB [Photobacterium nomapromontoriensis]|uniref:autotransporter assembly complex protein TamB n=1 Tax=Photobacterium nomapromontoriensis TaxID=2910237 RepID=UPI003D12095A